MSARGKIVSIATCVLDAILNNEFRDLFSVDYHIGVDLPYMAFYKLRYSHGQFWKNRSSMFITSYMYIMLKPKLLLKHSLNK